MKKFITTSPLQETLSCVEYVAVDNEALDLGRETCFPVIPLLNAYVEEGEKIKLIVIKIDMEYDECINEHLKNFEHLIEQIEDEDELYACMSYGTKAVPIIEMMALNYAHRAKFNTHIACIVYGATVFDKEAKITDAKIYDMTPLFYMDEIVRKVADMDVEDPLGTIQQILEL